MKTVKVGVLRMTYQLSCALEGYATFKNSHVCYQGAIVRNRNMPFVSTLLKCIEWNIKEVLNAIKDITTFPFGKGQVSLELTSFA